MQISDSENSGLTKSSKRYIERKLRKYWSPEQIAGRLRMRYGKTIICT